MAQAIRLKRITTPNYVPQVAELVAGEVAIDVAEGKLYALTGTEGNYSVSQVNTMADLSSIRITHVHAVAGEQEMIALQDVDEGDVAIFNDGNAYIHNGGVSGTFADWILLNMSAVSTVNGQQGEVTLDASNIEPVVDRNYVTDAHLQILNDIVDNGYDGGSVGGSNPEPTDRSRLLVSGATNNIFNTAYLNSNGGMTINGNSAVASSNYASYISSDGSGNNLVIIFNSVTNEYNLIATTSTIQAGSDIVIAISEIIGSQEVAQDNVNYPVTQGAYTLTYGA